MTHVVVDPVTIPVTNHGFVPWVAEQERILRRTTNQRIQHIHPTRRRPIHRHRITPITIKIANTNRIEPAVATT